MGPAASVTPAGQGIAVGMGDMPPGGGTSGPHGRWAGLPLSNLAGSFGSKSIFRSMYCLKT